ncbi:MAG TPA: hypothetical protein PL069_05015 [Saprospiraceae bacterium]|jgi:hypothetical protein|nr:MAG: hypothetical protein HWD63_12050 [Candidatus Parvibacillus calidus]HQP76746.1 hypothetical protein [Saprospiraceae bacterium]
MKKNYLFIGISVLIIAFSINNLTLDIDNRGHYIGNGILCGIGISIFVTQMLRLIRNK